jgi:hypothetical protein
MVDSTILTYEVLVILPINKQKEKFCSSSCVDPEQKPTIMSALSQEATSHPNPKSETPC